MPTLILTDEQTQTLINRLAMADPLIQEIMRQVNTEKANGPQPAQRTTAEPEQYVTERRATRSGPGGGNSHDGPRGAC